MRASTRRTGRAATILGGCGVALAVAATTGCVTSPQATTSTGAPAPAGAAATTTPLTATAALHDRAGASVGSARLSENVDGSVRLVVHVDGMTAGNHGIHFHTVGSCTPGDSTAFAAAGGHYNPAGRKHGLENPDGPHAGDLPNLVVGTNGSGDLDVVTNRATLRAGATSLLDADGSALVVHAGADDQRTDPSGNSGARLACGVVTAGGR